MIAKVSATGAAVIPVVAVAAEKANSAIIQQPVVWHFLGFPFEAASMVATLFGCLAARYWIGAAQAIRKEHRWSLDMPVSAMALATSAGVMMSMRPAPLYALLIGAGVGVIGEGIFKLAERQARATGAFGPPDKPE